MRLPNLSESMYVARLRYIQSIHESLERRNPDTLVRRFIPLRQRLGAAWLGREDLAKMRAEPFYHYLIARTKYYDEVLTDAVADGVQQIVIVGCGSDTRAYRFQDVLSARGVRVLECDQSQAIEIKQRMTKRWRKACSVEFLPIDLNDDAWPMLGKWLGDRTSPKSLVLMEGVSPYVNESTFSQFLRFLANTLSPGSHIAYDFKIRGMSDDEGRNGRTHDPFRLSAVDSEVSAYHRTNGLRLDRLEVSSHLSTRLLPGLEKPELLFGEDCLVRLQIPPARHA
jgi:methyltransferase (TIGR00027 family)